MAGIDGTQESPARLATTIDQAGLSGLTYRELRGPRPKYSQIRRNVNPLTA